MNREEAIKIVKSLYPTNERIINESLEFLIPELRESEDEKMRKELIRAFQSLNTIKVWNGIERTDIIDWLEKQSETDETKAKIFLINKGYPIDTNGIFPTYEEMYNIIREGLENQGEQKLGDNIEPKFHQGEWVVNKLGDSWYIDSFDKKNYQVSDGKGNYNYFPISKQDEMHLWSIADAKDGDVLAAYDCIVIFKEIDGLNIKCHCTYHYMGFNPSFCINTLHNKDAFHPTFKQYRDLQKIREQGLEWDDEDKKIKSLDIWKFAQ